MINPKPNMESRKKYKPCIICGLEKHDKNCVKSMESRFKKLIIKECFIEKGKKWEEKEVIVRFDWLLSFIKAELKANDKKWRARIKGMGKLDTTAKDLRRGTYRRGDDEYREGFNKALDNLLREKE